jgi:uncharacterized protein (DUF983 family)
VGRKLSRRPPATNYDQEYPFRTGLAGKCPRCGQGGLFTGYLDIADDCGVCGLDLSQQNSGDAGPFFIVMIVGVVIIGLALAVEMNFSPPVWLHMMLWMPSSLILSLALLRPAKGIMFALQYRYRVQFESDHDQP